MPSSTMKACLEATAIRTVFHVAAGDTADHVDTESQNEYYQLAKATHSSLRTLEAANLQESLRSSARQFYQDAQAFLQRIGNKWEPPSFEQLWSSVSTPSPRTSMWANAISRELSSQQLNLGVDRVLTSLIELPDQYAVLLRAANSEMCDVIKDQKRSAPALCLLCGSYSCLASPCCMQSATEEFASKYPVSKDESIGGCCRHSLQ